ncbi:MAG: glycosyltransferase family protein, partial [Solirubrobacteraceae bacterium]
MPAAEPRSERDTGPPEPPAAGPAILLWASGPLDQGAWRELLASVEQRVPAGVPVLTCAREDQAEQLSSALRRHPECDLVVLQAGTIVAPGWIEGLRTAAYSDSAVATATPLSLGAGGVEAQLDEREESLERAAERLSANPPRLWPRLARIGPACAYLRRSALELAGGLQPSLALPAALASLEQRTSACGLLHVAADEVLVDCRPLGTPEPRRRQDPVSETVEEDDRSPLHRALAAARWAVQPTVTIDGRSLVSAYGGTQTYLLGLIGALAEAGATTTRVLVPPDLSPLAQDTLAALEVATVSYEQVVEGGLRSLVVHRPQQVFSVDDLNLLQVAGERIVVGQQDLIAYHNRSYHADADRWRAYRRVTRLALAVA